ncbi:MAG: replication-associated recombination protein A, partial [Eubacterium sp.]|nr:replication-associated recombination protein A [Eubacterium sp.]
RIPLAEAAVYVATAPKSNASYMAIDSALSYVRTHPGYAIPPYLQDSHYKGAAKLGRGLDYKYAHDFPGHYVDQQYLPDEVKDERFFEPGENGYELKIREYFKKIGKS